MDDDDFAPAGPTDDVSLPKATIGKMLEDMLPDSRLTNDVRDLFVDCCTEFINLISSEANDISGKDNKKTIGPEHVLKALETLQFQGYLNEVRASHEQHKAEIKEGPKKNLKRARTNSGLSPEEAIAAQKALFASARASCYTGPPGAGPSESTGS